MKKLPNERLSGQALLIVMLTLAVVLSVVLSVASRSVTDVSVTTYEEEAQRAFDAAEAGVEKVLLEGVPVSEEIGQARYEASIGEKKPAGNEFVYPANINSGETAAFWFVSHNDNNQLVCNESAGKPCLDVSPIEFCWGNDAGDRSVIEVTVFYDESGQAVSANNYANVKVKRYVYDSHAASHPENNFTQAAVTDCQVTGQDFVYSTNAAQSINLAADLPGCGGPGCVLLIKTRALYNPNPLAIGLKGGLGDFPSQGETIESTGVAGESTRKVEVFQGYPEIPFIFDAALFSPGGVVK